ncbi:MAG: helix-turn-helix domain-containing protein [Spirochaetia bacterium]|nr:helix-turn-helix domain-containing protein [Spirochaetia bacterium]
MIYAGALYVLGYLYIINSLFYIWRLKDIKGLTLGASFIAFGYIFIYTGMVKSGHILSAPELMGTDTIMHAFGWIAIYFHIASIVNPQFKWQKKHWLFFIYPLIQIIIFSPYLFLSEEAKIHLIKKLITEGKITYYNHSFSLFLQLSMNIALGLYGVIAIRNKYSFKTAAPKYKNIIKFTRIFFISFVFIVTFGLNKILLLSLDLTEVSMEEYAFYYSTIFIFHLFVQLWPYYVRHGRVYFTTNTFHAEKYFSQYLEIEDIKNIEETLNHLVEKDMVYKNDTLNSGDLAKALKITPHQLSTFLNQHMNQTFSEFINSKRIEEAKKILSEESDTNILNICYDIGFNSPSAFYKAFRKETGITPKMFIKKELAKSKKGNDP